MRFLLLLPLLLTSSLASFATLPPEGDQAGSGATTGDETPAEGSGGAADGTQTLRDLIVDNDNLSQFMNFLDASDILEGILDEEEGGPYTVFAPTNEAMEASTQMQLLANGIDETPARWYENIRAACRNHIVPNREYKKEQIFDLQTTELDSMHDTLVVRQWSQQIGGASIIVADIQASNGILHIVKKVIDPEFFTQSFSKLELQSEYGPDVLDRISMVDVVDHVNGRGTLQTIRESGLTYAGCRIRAFNRMGLDDNYLWQTINGGQFVKEDELMSDNFTEQTLKNFVEYQLIPKNYYLDELPNNFVELVTPISNCGHMWVTKKDDRLCFNDGCVVWDKYKSESRQFLASNGVGYVIDRCPICSGVSMLTNYAAEYTKFSTYDVAQLFIGSEWNMRHLGLSVGDGSKVTLFAAMNSAMDEHFTLEDVTRMSTDKWRRHLWDLLKHFLVQGDYTKEDLKNMVLDNGGEPVQLTMLTGENCTLEYDPERNMVMLEQGDLFFGDIKGVDGFVHFTNSVPRPRSVTKTTYTVAKEDPRFKTHTDYIDSVFLDEDINRLSPLTVFYAPNEAFEGKLFDILELSDSLLENHIFKELLWCDKLVELAEADERIESHNGRTWRISVNEEGFPCFDTIQMIGDFAQKVCITKCDILVRNGIVHELENILVYETVETLAPHPPIAPGNSVGAPAAAPTSFSRPKNNGENGYQGPPAGAVSSSTILALVSGFLALIIAQ